MLKIKPNPDKEKFEAVSNAVEENEGYCCCLLAKNTETFCMCKEFREQNTTGLCRCGRFIKVEE